MAARKGWRAFSEVHPWWRMSRMRAQGLVCMCGIAGFWDVAHRLDAGQGMAALERMTQAIRHRGPDAAGTWRDEQTGVWLGHRRLAVVDLSS